MEFSVDNFAKSLKSGISSLMPKESDTMFQRKHKSRIGKMTQIALDNNQIIPIGTNAVYFELGNEMAETHTPQYHILEDAKIIHLKGQSTKKSRGSQANVDPRKRNYGRWTITTTSATQEYRKNYRVPIYKIGSNRRTIIKDGKKIVINSNTSFYVNTHYHYIEKILNDSGMLDRLANSFGLKRGRNGLDKDIEIKSQIGEDNGISFSDIFKSLATK